VCIALRSAWIPAPPPESEPAMVYTMEGVVMIGILLLPFWMVMSLDEVAAATANAVMDGRDDAM